jgi:hypothetical protein
MGCCVLLAMAFSELVCCVSFLVVCCVGFGFLFGDGFHVPLSDVRAWLQESMASQSYFESYFW